MSILAIVVSYFPDAAVANNVQALAREADAVLIVDNTPTDGSSVLLEPLRSDQVRVHYNHKNLGIGAALNKGVEVALEECHEWIATFDQDSSVTPGMFATMLRIYAARPDRESIGILCPLYRDQPTGTVKGHARIRGADIANGGREVLVTMTSGNLVRTDILATTGWFDEALFIDYVDYEFCIRCAKHGIKTLEVQAAVLDHNVGESMCHSFFGRQVVATNHSALRYYYAWRNRTYLCLKYWRILPFVKQSVGDSIKSAAIVLLFEKNRHTKFKSILHGLFDGIRGKLGPAV